MKKALFFLLALLGLSLYAQRGFNFKALLTDSNGNPLANTDIQVRVEIRTSSALLWSELHSQVRTDQYGIFKINIGEGSRIGGASDFDSVDWSLAGINYNVFINDGSGFRQFIANEPFKFVPYAKQADQAVKVTGVQDQLAIGADAQGRFLLVEGTPSASPELIRFKLTSSTNGMDLLDLEMAAPSSGRSQFIECNTNGHRVFTLDHNGDVFLEGKILRYYTLDVDFLPIAWGAVRDNGTPFTGSNNYDVTQTATGVYKITLSGISSYSTADYAVIANPGFNSVNVFVRSYVAVDGFYIKVTDQSGNAVNKSFNFLVFKK